MCLSRKKAIVQNLLCGMFCVFMFMSAMLASSHLYPLATIWWSIRIYLSPSLSHRVLVSTSLYARRFGCSTNFRCWMLCSRSSLLWMQYFKIYDLNGGVTQLRKTRSEGALSSLLGANHHAAKCQLGM